MANTMPDFQQKYAEEIELWTGQYEYDLGEFEELPLEWFIDDIDQLWHPGPRLIFVYTYDVKRLLAILERENWECTKQDNGSVYALKDTCLYTIYPMRWGCPGCIRIYRVVDSQE